MNSFETLRQRVSWTRTWLNSIHQPTEPIEDGEINFCEQGDLLSSGSTSSSSFSLLDDVTAKSCGQLADDVIALSSQDPGTDCTITSADYEEDEEPPAWCWVCQEWHAATARPIHWCGICSNCHGPDGMQVVWDEGAVLIDTGDPTLMTAKQGINYELSGRHEDNTFRDLRSAAKARKRKRTERTKYYSYKYIKPGQLDTPHYDYSHDYDALFHRDCERYEIRDPDVVTMDKKQLYHEAQRWPRPPTYHRRRGEKEYYPWSRAYEKRLDLWKHADFNAREAEEERFDDGCTVYSDSIAEWNEERAEAKAEEREYGWCIRCDVEWGRCADNHLFEVDNVTEIMFEPKVTRSGVSSWDLKWKVAEWNPLPHNRGPATLSYGKLDWDYRPGVDAFSEDDAERYEQVGWGECCQYEDCTFGQGPRHGIRVLPDGTETEGWRDAIDEGC